MTSPATGMSGMTYVDALIIVDVQNDFCPPDGKLKVPRGNTIIPTLIRYLDGAFAKHIPVFASRDWHPAPDAHGHTDHFDTWPDHCIQGTKGAEFRPEIERYRNRMRIVTKGDNLSDDGYSAFEGLLDPDPALGFRDPPTLGQVLRAMKVTRVFVGGLATDYCVKATVLDALDPQRTDRPNKKHLTEAQAAHQGLAVAWLSDASLPVEAQQGDGERAVRAMLAAGATAITIEQFAPTPGKEPALASGGKSRR